MDRKQIIRELWIGLESTHKSIKDLYDNTITPNSTFENLWTNSSYYRNNLKHIRNLKLNTFYVFTDYQGNEKLILRTEDYTKDESGNLCMKCRVIASLKKEAFYRDVEDTVLYSFDRISEGKELDLKVELLPMYVAWEFKGTLYNELLKEGGIECPPTSPTES